ncbi:uncharacterized protein DNG_06970 [Cephalotrichum gorgonifer]|uniref:Uncharacterized protein n=1 Tax=Cephalotrichum gorgonifer TaxID=2041049 RepID=A0AAE8N3Q6_9PEZI|nr:uncharacterized protein DNG_06970 [Cephalotrichum gorgonifer]
MDMPPIFIFALIIYMRLFHKNPPMEETAQLMHKWRSSLSGRLGALHLLPNFLPPAAINL